MGKSPKKITKNTDIQTYRPSDEAGCRGAFFRGKIHSSRDFQIVFPPLPFSSRGVGNNGINE